ncbi:MAG: thiolase family protein, partial [Gemmatimonadaceae bacterium]
MSTPVIVSAARTPIGRFLSSLAPLTAPELGAVAIKAAIERAQIDPAEIGEVIMGNVLQAGVGQAPARQAQLKAGIPASIPAYTVNKVCGSGLQAVMLAAQAIRAGDEQLLVAGGQESMSNAPHLVTGIRSGVKFGAQVMQDALIKDGLWCAFYNRHMGGHAEYTAKKAGITRQRQDELAFRSHMKAVAAIEGGKFKAEIAPAEIAGKKGPTIVDTDEGPRKDTTLEALAKLRPAFPGDAPKDMKPEELTVTAGNAPGLNDGGAALVIADEEYAKANGLPILARITGYASGGGDPQELFFAPIVAVQNLMKKTCMKIGDFD